MTITTNEAHVDDLIRSGDIAPGDRWENIARLYKGQLAACRRQKAALAEWMRVNA